MSLDHLTDDDDRLLIADITSEIAELSRELLSVTRRALEGARAPGNALEAMELLLIEQVHHAASDFDVVEFLGEMLDQL